MTTKQKNITYIFIIQILLVSCTGGKKDQLSFRQTYKDIRFTDQFKCSEGWIAGDGAYSIPMGNNKSFWTFGDSYLDCYDTTSRTVPCLFQARNAAMVIDVSDPSVKVTLRNSNKEPTFFTSGTDNNFWFWPVSGFTHADTVYIFLSRIRSTGEPGMWGFTGVDSNYLAKVHTSDLSHVRYSVLPSKNGINFGVSLIEHGKFTLIYGIRPNGFGNDLFVARFRTDNIYSGWEYFDGEGWNTEISKIMKIHSEFTASFNLCRIRDKYILITTEFSVGCDQGKNIFIATSNSPGGPFTAQHPVWQTDDTLNGHLPFFYMANAHPEFDNGKKELLITYCINGYGSCIETCIDNRLNPDVYRPKAIRVPYSVIDNTL